MAAWLDWAVAACGGRRVSELEAPGSHTACGSITFMSRDNGIDLEPYKQGIARFNASQSKVKSRTRAGTGNYFQKLQTLVASGPPDVSYMHSANVPTFAQGTLAPLDRTCAGTRGPWTGCCPPRWTLPLEEGPGGRPGRGHQPRDVRQPLALRAAGAPLPSPTWTWADYLSTAQRIANAGRAEGSFGAVDYNGSFPRYTVLWQNDADVLNKDRTAVPSTSPPPWKP